MSYAQPVEVLPFFNLTLLHNTGAAFSFLAGADRTVTSRIVTGVFVSYENSDFDFSDSAGRRKAHGPMMGAYAGAHMAHAGENVTFIDAWPENVETMKAKGLKVTHLKDVPEFTAKVRALHITEGEVEAALSDALGDGPFRLLVDLGTGSLANVVSAINKANAGVTAGAVQVAAGQYRLQLTATDTGEGTSTGDQTRARASSSQSTSRARPTSRPDPPLRRPTVRRLVAGYPGSGRRWDRVRPPMRFSDCGYGAIKYPK